MTALTLAALTLLVSTPRINVLTPSEKACEQAVVVMKQPQKPRNVQFEELKEWASGPVVIVHYIVNVEDSAGRFERWVGSCQAQPGNPPMAAAKTSD